MGSFTNFAEQKVLDRTFNKDSSYTPVATVYLGLCLTDPGEAATGASCGEVANSGNYARKAIAFGAAASRQVVQSGSVQFNQATGDWGNVGYWVVVDNGTYGSGNVLGYGALDQAQQVYTDDTPTVASGEVIISITAGEVSNYLANICLDWLFNQGTFTAPTTYVGFALSALTDATTGSTVSEPSGGSYARKLVYENTGGTPDWDVAVADDPNYMVDNSDDVSFTTATGDWGTCVAVFVADASSAGNILMYDNDMTDKPVNSGNTAKFPAATLVAKLS